MKKLRAAALLALVFNLAGCGYSHSPSPYGLAKSLIVNVPVAVNSSRYGDMGPDLTQAVIARLDASDNIVVRESAPACLKMTITRVDISGGAWNPNRNEYKMPKASASRVVSLTVEATLERPGQSSAQFHVNRHLFTSSRNFYVNDDESQMDLLQAGAIAWVIDDISQKITQTMFSEF
ncbi:MAG: hypothetical protein AMR96_05645 [Candidatus Adiutrix intracellularis]|jgi:outer membrane lipopolysaccharide assembly protein LptE/RlpB|nr:MAG: hypothetical protein AMR96_05645 [Candidatus Adiutrix intracellularis]MDR2826981.1 LPS assembly lipoprotein LptE [Candidatus Adiutrix intracellularis]